MVEHEGWWSLLVLGKVTPIEVGLDSAICGVVIEVQFKQVGVRKRQCQACRNTAKVDWAQEWVCVCQRHSRGHLG